MQTVNNNDKRLWHIGVYRLYIDLTLRLHNGE